ncbi:restriction endonuclease subunit S [Vibrio fluvialis]|uniref:restriction endonuclease subunit S n=1 Tax=Vibrio fluvialis TaxID=676 RepID=UPI001EEC2E53|nr:restriction endonuclease subunit S [Vibrio fluvialis]EKO3403704.1 restriction endonuclease subunit S [Vibrio fluvialis]MCG6385707.1 restriction endonuclease subunit S [Vibrio fluvialis]
MAVENLITEHIDIWTSAVKTKSTSGLGSSKKLELYGVKKLRELILELAVQGKLVPQDPNDEPASVLLERIKDERRAEAKNGKLKEVKAISENEFPYKLPINWSFVRLEEIIQISSGKNLTAKKMDTSGKIPVYGGNGVTGIHSESNVSEKTIVIGRVGFYCGSVHLTPACAWVTDNAFITKYSRANLDEDFLVWLLKATNLGENDSATAQPVISGKKVYPIVVALPPKEEQRLIAAKIDELLALCDQLEQQTEASIEAHQVLVTTLLDTLTNSADADELMQNWARISEHFDTLFTTEESIDQLKQTILQLAVMGKLVSQDPNDEPASELLKRIAEEKAQLILKKEIPKAKKFEEISVEDNAFSAPSNWSWVRLETVFNVIVDCPHSTAKFQDEGLLCIDTNSFKQGQLHPNRFRFVSEETFDKRNARLVPKSRDIIFAREGSVGESVVIPEGVECCLGQRVMLFRPSESLNAEFLRLTISNKGALNQLLVLHKGIGAKHVNVGDMRAFVICLPPKMEQDRIVDKVNELLGLCELLKSSLKDFQSTQLYLTDTIIDRAVQL